MREFKPLNQTLSPEEVWKKYEQGRSFKTRIQLYDEVEKSENFFIGKQWEGVRSNGLPTPVFNFLKRVTLFTVASVTTDNIKMQARPMGVTGLRKKYSQLAGVVNQEFEALFEHNSIGDLIREFMRNAAVDGDGCMYTYWDAEQPNGHPGTGAIVTEIVENTRVIFGNPADRRVSRQPWIMIEKRVQLPELAERAEALGVKNLDELLPDAEAAYCGPDRCDDDDKATVLMLFYKNPDTDTVWLYECTRSMEMRHQDLKLKRYPITWLNWDYRRDCYHGQSLISGLIPNQIFINKLFAMTMISLMTTAYPKVVYDKTRIDKWTNGVGQAIGIKGGDVNSVAKILDPAQVSPEVAQFIKLAVDYTQTFLGATSAALGETRPDNTSAIIALQRASAVPHEITRQNLYSAIEELGRIYMDFMSVYYGERTVELKATPDLPDELGKFLNMEPGSEVEGDFDFSGLDSIPMTLKLDVGASAYWSEVASMQTLDNLLSQGRIDMTDYLERIPDGYISGRQELLEKLKNSSTDTAGTLMKAVGEQAAQEELLPMQGVEHTAVQAAQPETADTPE